MIKSIYGNKPPRECGNSELIKSESAQLWLMVLNWKSAEIRGQEEEEEEFQSKYQKSLLLWLKREEGEAAAEQVKSICLTAIVKLAVSATTTSLLPREFAQKCNRSHKQDGEEEFETKAGHNRPVNNSHLL